MLYKFPDLNFNIKVEKLEFDTAGKRNKISQVYNWDFGYTINQNLSSQGNLRLKEESR